MNNLCDCGLSQLGAKFLETRSEQENPPKFALATEIDRAIDLSCVRCDGDGRWAWIPGGGLRSAPFPPPTSDPAGHVPSSRDPYHFSACTTQPQSL